MDISLTDIGADSPVHGFGDAHPGQHLWARKSWESGRIVWGLWWDHEVGVSVLGNMGTGPGMPWQEGRQSR